MLTKRQKQALDYIKAYQREHGGVSPAMIEIGKAIGTKHKSVVHRLLTGLEQRGHIVRLPNRARAIDVLPERQTVRMRKMAGGPCRAVPMMGYIN